MLGVWLPRVIRTPGIRRQVTPNHTLQQTAAVMLVLRESWLSAPPLMSLLLAG